MPRVAPNPAFQAKYGTCAKFTPNRATMVERIFYFADILGMEIPPEFRDESGLPSKKKVEEFRENNGRRGPSRKSGNAGRDEE